LDFNFVFPPNLTQDIESIRLFFFQNMPKAEGHTCNQNGHAGGHFCNVLILSGHTGDQNSHLGHHEMGVVLIFFGAQRRAGVTHTKAETSPVGRRGVDAARAQF
jgi:hypothetical protein